MRLSRKQVPDKGNLPDNLKVEKGKKLSQEEIHDIIAGHHTALNSGEGVLKNGHRNRVTRVYQLNGLLCVKEYRSPALADRFKEWLRGSRARRAWEGALHLHKHGISAPEIVSLIKQGRRSYLVTRFITGAIPLNRLLRERFTKSSDPLETAAKRAMIRQLGPWLRRIHDLGIYHDDWSTKNILTTQHNEKWHFHLLDMESVLPRKPLTYRRRVKNLAQISDAPFGVTRTDRMRFLLAYAGDDTTLTRGKFPHDVLVANRLRLEKWAKVRAKAIRRKARLKQKVENVK
jgi:tRNA A-37 threonylcarbamoyl transferase component Bud32